MGISSREEQALIWDYYKPRHTHAWNMLVLSWQQLDQFDEGVGLVFEDEYHWENFILRLWLYRTTIKALTKIQVVEADARSALTEFDRAFSFNGQKPA
jgi:hypothetical protein